LGTQSSSAALVRFGHFELMLGSGELRKDGKTVNLAPQPARILVLLVSRAGQIVTRQEIAQEVWGSSTFVDFEQGLNFAIRQIRAALGDDADRPQYVETMPKRGYRFVGAVEQVASPGSEAAPSLLLEPEEDKTHRFAGKWLVIALTGAIALGVSAAILRSRFEKRDVAPTFAIHSIAVLPLANLSADPAQDYFTEGLTDELITEVARLKTIRVVSRTSTMVYKDRHVLAPQIGRELGVDGLIEGTVERQGNKIRIRAQLIQAATDQHLWAESYDRDSSDVLMLETEVARDIAQQIGQFDPELNLALKRQHPISTSAHDDYLRGRYYWNKRTEAGLRRGIEYFQRAIDQAPDYALAYSGLADSYIMLANWGMVPASEAYPKAREASLRAVELDDQLAEAQTSLAYVTLLYDRNWKDAEKRFKQAITLNPNYASAHHFYSILLVTAGRNSEAVAEIRKAQELDPLSLIVNDVVGWIYYESRQYEQADRQYNETLQMDPTYVPALLDQATIQMRVGQYRNSLERLHKAQTITGDNGVVLSDLAQAYALSGNRAAARQILRKVGTAGGNLFVSDWDLALIHLALGEKAKAIDLLSRAADKHVGWIIRVGVDPAFDTVRSEPGFQQLLRRVGIPTITNTSER